MQAARAFNPSGCVEGLAALSACRMPGERLVRGRGIPNAWFGLSRVLRSEFGCCVVCLTSLAMLAASARQRKMIRRFPESCAHSRLGADARARAVFVAAGVTQLAQSVLVAPVVT